MNRQARRALFARLRAADPNPVTELRYRTPFELLVAVMLSAQATDKSVNRATESLFRRARTPGQLLELGESGLREHIRSIGLFNTKARNIIRTCAILVDRYQGHVPRDRGSLEALPGVGRKTANVILNTAFDEPTIAVDTHIYRVSNRTGLAQGKTVRQVEEGLQRVVPSEFKKNAHHWLILHGRYTCRARRPRCDVCVIADLCDYGAKEGVPDSFPSAHT